MFERFAFIMLPVRLPAVLPIVVPRFMLELVFPLCMLAFDMLAFDMLVFIIGVGVIIGVLTVFKFDIVFALRALTLMFVFPVSPQPKEPAAKISEAVKMVFLMVSPVSC